MTLGLSHSSLSHRCCLTLISLFLILKHNDTPNREDTRRTLPSSKSQASKFMGCLPMASFIVLISYATTAAGGEHSLAIKPEPFKVLFTSYFAGANELLTRSDRLKFDNAS